MTVMLHVDRIGACVGQRVATSEWLSIDQARVQAFADATGDHQWIHTDPVRARKGPFGVPIAHGLLTLSLIPAWLAASIQWVGVGMAINYGLNRVRFMAPVPVGSRLRAHFDLLASDPADGGALQLTWQVQVECEGAIKPVCAAELLVRLYPAAP